MILRRIQGTRINPETGVGEWTLKWFPTLKAAKVYQEEHTWAGEVTISRRVLPVKKAAMAEWLSRYDGNVE